MTELEWAIIAQWVSADGCVRIKRLPPYQGGYTVVRVTIKEKDLAMLRWIQDRVGGRLYERRRQLSIYRRDVGPLLESCLPYVIANRRKIERAIKFSPKTTY